MTTPDKMQDGAGTVHLAMIPLADAPYRGAYRWAIYRTDTPQPVTLWGPYIETTVPDPERKTIAAATWPGMVYFPRPERGRDLPAFHFALDFGPGSWGRTEAAERFAGALARKIGRPVVLSLLSGWHPDTVTGAPA